MIAMGFSFLVSSSSKNEGDEDSHDGHVHRIHENCLYQPATHAQ